MKEKVFVGGFDEAGRGAVIGPLVVAGVSFDKEDVYRLRKMGVRDSKLLTAKKRERLVKEIEKLAKDIIVIKVGPCKIDNYRKQGVNLNRLEAMKFAEVISYLGPHQAYVDSPDVNPERLKKILEKMVGDGVEIISEHKADHKYPVVGAASIIAKVERDEEIRKLKKKYGDIGPGYSSNPITVKWLKEWLEENRDYPEGVVRKTWITADGIKKDKLQKRLTSWFKRIKNK